MNITKELSSLVLLGLSLLFCSFSFAQTSKNQCPDGYYADFNGEVCISLEFQKPAVTLPDDGTCRRGMETFPSTRFCFINNSRLSAQAQTLVLTPLPTAYCPENFSRPSYSSICAANNMVFNIDSATNSLTIEEAPDICEVDPAACQSPPNRNVGLFKMLCPIGFLMPPGSHFCTAEDLVFNPNPPGDLPIPEGECPDGWQSTSNSAFCSPIHTVRICDENANCGVTDPTLTEIIARPTDCSDGTFTRFGTMPRAQFNDQGIGGFTSIPIWFCSPPNRNVGVFN